MKRGDLAVFENGGIMFTEAGRAPNSLGGLGMTLITRTAAIVLKTCEPQSSPYTPLPFQKVQVLTPQGLGWTWSTSLGRVE